MTRDVHVRHHSKRRVVTLPNLGVTLRGGWKPRGSFSGGFSHRLEEYIPLALQASRGRKGLLLSVGGANARRLLGGSMCAQILVSTLIGMPARCIALSSKWPWSLAERGSVFTPSPLPGNPYAIQFSKYYRTLLREEVTSGNSEAKASNAYHCR
jgi:hypothetical protein